MIDFWGARCGPCVAQLDEVNAAARQIADSKIVSLDLHDASGQAERALEFVKRRFQVLPENRRLP